MSLKRLMNYFCSILVIVMTLCMFSGFTAFAEGPATETSAVEESSAEETSEEESSAEETISYEEEKAEMLEKLGNATLKLSKTSFVFNAKEQKPSVTLMTVDESGSSVADTGFVYTVAYNGSTGNLIDAGEYTVKVEVTGFYTTDKDGNKITVDFDSSKTLSASYEITPRDISSYSVELSTTEYTYGNVERKPSTTVRYTSGGIMPEKSGSKVNYTRTYSNNINAGTATVKITGTGNYKGTVSATFTIKPADISGGTMSLSTSTYTYNGSERKPAPTITTSAGLSVSEKSGTTVNFTKSYSNNINAGTATIKVTGTGNFTGTLSQNYTINPADISGYSVSLSTSTYTYNGTERKPAPTVTNASGATLAAGNYTKAYSNNINAGTATLKITGTGNYKGTITKTYTINPADISGYSVSLSTSTYTYNGTERKPSPTVTNASGAALAAGNYTKAYSNNINAGTATLKITGTGNYKGTITKTYTINPADISAYTVELSTTTYTFGNVERKPAPTVKNASGTVLAQKSGDKVNWDKAYSNNFNAGTATIKITGTGNYKGTITKNYTINKADISTIALSKIAISATSFTYTGSSQKPTVTSAVKNLNNADVTLKAGTDFSVNYPSDTTSIGTKTIALKGMGNFTGTRNITYKIYPEKASGLKVTGTTTTSVSLSATAAKESGCKYEWLLKVYDADAEKWVTDSSKTQKTSSNTATFSGLVSGKQYRFDVRIFKDIDSVTYNGAYCGTVTCATNPAKPNISSLYKTSTTAMKVSWGAISYASGYQVQYSTASDMSGAQSVTTASTSASIGSLANKTYYVRVRSYRTVAGKNYYSAWSTVKNTNYSNVYASYSTTYRSSNVNRTTNLQVACKAINGTILASGATFDFNKVVGPRTAARGYKEAIVYQGGEEVAGIGGGICQVATTIFNAALRANFTINLRYQHSMTVHYVPLGYDAAISGSAKNLRFTNNSGTTIKIEATCSGGTLTMKFLTNVYKKPPTVKLSVTCTKGTRYKHRYTLRRTVDGKVNYTCYSEYSDD